MSQSYVAILIMLDASLPLVVSVRSLLVVAVEYIAVPYPAKLLSLYIEGSHVVYHSLFYCLPV